jgi:hypothetical protein
MKRFLKFIKKYPYILVSAGLWFALVGYTECGWYHQCSQSSWARKAEVLGIGLAVIGILMTIVLLFYKLLTVFNKLKKPK